LWAGEPLHQQIDKLIDAKLDGEPAPVASDAAFFRRVNLDLAGNLPEPAAVRAFLASKAKDKRAKAISKLLAADEYTGRMANLFHVMLMERRGDDGEWEKFLRECFAQNKPWNQMVREILMPVRDDEQKRGAAYFYTRRLTKVGAQETDHPGLTRDVGRLFLGIDLQCAQCHDHLTIEDYMQRDFQGLYAVFQNVSIRREKFPAINEKAMTERLSFISVFGSDEKTTGPRLPFTKEFDLPKPPPTDGKPKKRRDPNEPPSFSALKLIAEELPSVDNQLFRKNIANRLWFFMMGRGLVEPLDQFHSENKPTHPKLLELLANELAAHKFDIKWFIEQLAQTKTYQRSSRMPDGAELPPASSYRLAKQRALTAEQLFVSTLRATGNLQHLAPAAGKEPSEAFTKLKTGFMKSFAGEPAEPVIGYTPAVKQALFLLNDSQVLELFKPQHNNLAERLNKAPDAQVAEELYLSIFSRLPDQAERLQVEEYLQQNKKTRPASISQLAWAMLSSMEFAVNH